MTAAFIGKGKLLSKMGKLRVQNTAYSVGELVHKVEEGEIDMNPPYQRGLVWTLEQKVLLIDSFLYGIGIPALYLRFTDNPRPPGWEIIDGKQRLNTFVEFFHDKFEFDGKAFSRFPMEKQLRLKRQPLAAIEVRDASMAEILELYERINFCGVPHTK